MKKHFEQTWLCYIFLFSAMLFGCKKETEEPQVNNNNLGKILFSSNRDGNDEIYVMDADGSNQKRLTNNTDSDTNPVWSPDRKKIVFSSKKGGDRYKLYVMNADGSNPQPLVTGSLQNTGTGGGHDIYPSFTHDGKYIVFTSNRTDSESGTSYQLYIMAAEGSQNPASITNSQDDVSGSYPSCGPNGKIAFACAKSGGFELYIATPLSGGGYTRTQLTDYLSSQPSWSPDGSKIAFYDVSKSTGISVIDLNSDQKTNVYPMSYPFDAIAPKWSPDSKKIAFACNVSGSYQIYTMDENGANVVCLTSEGSNFCPGW